MDTEESFQSWALRRIEGLVSDRDRARAAHEIAAGAVEVLRDDLAQLRIEIADLREKLATANHRADSLRRLDLAPWDDPRKALGADMGLALKRAIECDPILDARARPIFQRPV